MGNTPVPSDVIRRIQTRLKFEREDLVLLEKKALDTTKDAHGVEARSVASSKRFLAVAEYVVDGNIEGFQSTLTESAQIRLNLLERYSRGEPISPSFVSMSIFTAVLDFLAAGDFRGAEQIAAYIGSHPNHKYLDDHPFDLAFGDALKVVVLEDKQAASSRCSAFSELLEKNGNRDFIGYGNAIDAILDHDSPQLGSALETIVKGHIRQSKNRGLFRYKVDAALCVWGLGVANLATYHGLNPVAVPPLIPSDLLIPGTTKKSAQTF